MLCRLLLSVGSTLLLTACFPYQSASSGAVGCPPVDVEIRNTRFRPGANGPTRTWTAICRDREHLCSAAGSSGAACTRIAPEDGELARSTRQVHRLDRGFDNEQQTPSVSAQIRLDVRRWIALRALPRVQEEVEITMRLLKHRTVTCEHIQWKLNGIPHAPVYAKVKDEGPTFGLSTQLGSEFIRELQRPHPSLSVEGCGQTLTVEGQALDTVVEFAKVYSDLAESSE